MSRPPRVTHLEHPSRRDGDSLQHGRSVFTWRADEFVFSPGDFTGRGVSRKWPRSAVRGFYAEVVGSRTSSLPRGRLVMSLHDGTMVELVPSARMSQVVVLSQQLEQLRNGLRIPRTLDTELIEPLHIPRETTVSVEDSGDMTTIVVRPNPTTDTGVVQFQVSAASLAMHARTPGAPEERRWDRAAILDVTISTRANSSRVQEFELRIHIKNAPKFDALLESLNESRLEPILNALRSALGLPSRVEASRAWLGVAPPNLPDDTKVSGDVLPYAPEPQDKPSIERTPGALRIFVPRERIWETLNRTSPVLPAVVVTLLASLFLAWWFAPTARQSTAIAFMTVPLVVIGTFAVVGPVLKRCVTYRKIETGEDARLTLTVRSPLKTQKQAWRVEDVREVLLRTGFPRIVAIRLATSWIELAGFRDGTDAEEVADALSQSLGFLAGPTRW